MNRLLIANRGEIALRILRACRDMGIETVAAYTQADRHAVHLDYADQAVCVGKDNYLDEMQLISAALSRHCDALHPGYGFLSENAAFARSVNSAGLSFVGPEPAHIELMGNKPAARAAARGWGLPVLPGSEGEIGHAADAVLCAAGIGYPLMVKASHGGGGRGIAVADDEAALRLIVDDLLHSSARMFGEAGIYLEKWLPDSRHIEVQVFGDGKGSVIHFGTRECSVQRRHQKLLEESPPPGISTALLDQLATDCCAALSHIGYADAGTLEFLYRDEHFYFIEMNTRIQVEHPVTECVTGTDLVKLQLEFARSKRLWVSQADIQSRGHAIECRINAEDENFRPTPGVIDQLHLPGGPGIRWDSHIYQGYRMPYQYDSLLGKLLAWGSDRNEAIARMSGALAELVIEPVTTNRRLHETILMNQHFRSGQISTGFLEALQQ